MGAPGGSDDEGGEGACWWHLLDDDGRLPEPEPGPGSATAPPPVAEPVRSPPAPGP